LKNIALIDNYDSFTYNLLHLLEKAGNVKVQVFLNDRITINELNDFYNIVISPGPGLPSQAGIVPELLQKFSSTKNILGICLGMQAIGENYNSPLKNLNTVMHGLATPIRHLGKDFLFKNIPATFNGGRYHSWVIDKEKISNDLEITAVDDKGEIMGIKHKQYNVRGVQFHPESILSEYGEVMMRNWIDKLK
jgi:anthranilate synthase component 2